MKDETRWNILLILIGTAAVLYSASAILQVIALIGKLIN